MRQQNVVIDGGGIAHAHYRLQLWPESGMGGGGVAHQNTGAPHGPLSGAGPMPAGATGGAFATDELWVSPPANFRKGQWDEQHMAEVGWILLMWQCTKVFTGTAL